MGEEQTDVTLRFRLHLNTGTSIDVLIYEDDVEEGDPEGYAQSMIEEFNENRPGWYRLGNILFFSGAVTAIEIEVV